MLFQVSLKRINAFVNADELDPNSVQHETGGEDNVKNMVNVTNASFSWEKDTEPFLRDIDLKV